MPEVSRKYVRVDVKKPKTGKLKTIVIDKKKGIKASVEVINNKVVVITHLFSLQKNWSTEDSVEWSTRNPCVSDLDYKAQLRVYQQVYMPREDR